MLSKSFVTLSPVTFSLLKQSFNDEKKVTKRFYFVTVLSPVFYAGDKMRAVFFVLSPLCHLFVTAESLEAVRL
jgi:hypothetical protein